MGDGGETVTISIGLFIAIVVAVMMIGACFGFLGFAMCNVAGSPSPQPSPKLEEREGKK